MSLRWPIKDPDSVIDYGLDWTDWLNGDAISSSEFLVPTGITKNDDLHDDTTTTVWLSGGSVGRTYDIVNRIQTMGGRREDRTIQVRISEK
jgi:hypothetical protein